MKLFIFLISIFLISCVQPPTTDKGKIVHFYYSSWKEVNMADVSKGVMLSETIDLDSQLAIQSAYNSSHIDDAILGPYLGEDVPIDIAPEAPIYIVNADTLKVYYQATIPRAELSTKRSMLQSTLEAMADPDTGIIGTNALYVDHIPPAPPPPPIPKLWTALLDITAQKIYYSEHWQTEEEAISRYQKAILPQVDQYNLFDILDGVDVPGHIWQGYLGEVEATFQEVSN